MYSLAQHSQTHVTDECENYDEPRAQKRLEPSIASVDQATKRAESTNRSNPNYGGITAAIQSSRMKYRQEDLSNNVPAKDAPRTTAKPSFFAAHSPGAADRARKQVASTYPSKQNYDGITAQPYQMKQREEDYDQCESVKTDASVSGTILCNPYEQERWAYNDAVGALAVTGGSGSVTHRWPPNYQELAHNNEGTQPQEPEPAIVADPITQEDVEAQFQERMRDEASNIANIVEQRLMNNAVVAQVDSPAEQSFNGNIDDGASYCSMWRLVKIVALVLTIAAIGAGIGTAVSNRGTTTPATPTTVPPTEDVDLRSILDSISGDRLDDQDSPQFMALYWLSNEDPANTTVGSTPVEVIKSRYAAAVVYYSLGGTEWTDQLNFLTAGDICSWNQNQDSGIFCSSVNNDVMELYLR